MYMIYMYLIILIVYKTFRVGYTVIRFEELPKSQNIGGPRNVTKLQAFNICAS